MAFGLLKYVTTIRHKEMKSRYKLSLTLQIQCAMLHRKCEIRELEKVSPEVVWPVEKELSVLTSKPR